MKDIFMKTIEDLKINEFCRLEDFSFGRKAIVLFDIILPSEIVIRHSLDLANISLTRARIYGRFNLFIRFIDSQPKILTYKELLLYENFKGTGYENELVLTEVYEDCGQDGRIIYELIGFRLVSYNELEKQIKNYTNGGSIPYFMLLGDEDL